MSARPLAWDFGLALFGGAALLDLPLPWTAIALILMFGPGLAHGALDARLSPRAGPGFYLAYLLACTASAGLWWASPTLGLLVFIGLATWHFGEAELAGHQDLAHRAALFLSRGALLVLWPVLLRLPEAQPVLEAMGVALPPVEPSFRWVAASSLLGAHLLLLARVLPRPRLAREFVSLFAALALMTSLPLLEGFIIWFSLGHAGAHLHALRRREAASGSWRRLLAEALPTWSAAFAAIGLLAIYLGSSGADARGWAAAFIGLGVLTTPHMLLVARWHTPSAAQHG